MSPFQSREAVRIGLFVCAGASTAQPTEKEFGSGDWGAAPLPGRWQHGTVIFIKK